MIMLMVLITVSALFWGLYEQTYGPWVLMAEIGMDRKTFGIDWTAGQTTRFRRAVRDLDELPLRMALAEAG